ncbi:uncharacterized protein LOC116207329 [Punica granatum]|uniref:Uncharacterized protein LOC116207329 n=2 Tax=Punica granatum TaxID=22663 RepID=A0A6P8DNU1_PUNGR|nr:uncharacterized protein LOC116207329 [Punica granatum]PKI35278.1 hypothetical protein CRG98_044292 [Punica granatum]
MTRHLVLRLPSVNRRQPLLKSRPSSAAKAAEVAGGTTAECAAVCCCCPCVVAGLLVLAVYRLPAGLCRRALRRRRLRRLSKQAKGGKCSKCSCGCEEHEPDSGAGITVEELLEMKAEESPEMEELEEEMRKNFYSTGFWRSPSQTKRD